jgi:hypothetical protein
MVTREKATKLQVAMRKATKLPEDGFTEKVTKVKVARMNATNSVDSRRKRRQKDGCQDKGHQEDSHQGDATKKIVTRGQVFKKMGRQEEEDQEGGY